MPQLSFAKAYHDTAGGRVSVLWERKGGEIKLTIEKEEGVFGEIRLPEGYVFKDSQLTFKKLESGELTITDLNYESDDIIEV